MKNRILTILAAIALSLNCFGGSSMIPGTVPSLVTASITNGLATITYVNLATQGLVTASITNGLALTAYIDAAFATRTNLYNVTGSVVVSNSLPFTIPLLYSPVNLADCRFYLSTTNGAPISRRAIIRIMQKPDDRCTDLIYLYTNQLYYSTTTTVAGAADAYTNVVGDASGFIINDMYVKPQANPVTWQTVSNYNATTVFWNCSNMVTIAVGGLISHVNRFQIPFYIDKNGGTNLYVNIQWTSGYTNTISYNISYYRK